MESRNLQQAILRVVEHARTIDVGHYQWRERRSLQNELLPAIREVLSDAITVFTRVHKYYKPTLINQVTRVVPDASGANPREDIGPAIEAGDGTQRITDLSFMAQWELTREREGLGEIKSGKETWAVLAECGRACSRLITSAIAIENAMCTYEGLSSSLLHLYHSELNRSLRVRHAYARFRQSVAGSGPPTAENVCDQLRSAVIGIAQLLGTDIYRDLRASDRMRIESLQRRLIEWLDADSEGDPLEGIRLWQDIKNISELLLEVNKRAELRDHDQAVAAVTYGKLFGTDNVPDPVPQDIQFQLQSLFGSDEELDRLIADPGSYPAEDWKGPLERLLKNLSSDPPLSSP
jgi:hypothetical protein